jgi:hypothetical protein
MLTYQDDFTKLVLSKTLAHYHDDINRGKLHAGGYRNFADFILRWMILPHVDVHLAINRGDVDENGIAKEVGFCWHFINEETLNPEFERVNDKKNWDEPYYYNLDLKKYLAGYKMIGALINHGTTEQPNWGSHT